MGNSSRLSTAAVSAVSVGAILAAGAASAATDPADTLAVWGHEETVVDRQLIVGEPDLVMTTADRAAVVWSNRKNATGPGYYVATRSRGETWSAPRRLSASIAGADVFAHGRSLTTASIVTLPGADPGTYGGAEIALQTMSSSGQWGAVRTPFAFGAEQPVPQHVRGGGSPDGTLAVTWESGGVTYGSVRPPGGPWSTPAALAESGVSTLRQTNPVWVSEDGHAVVALYDEDTTRAGTIVVAEAGLEGTWTSAPVTPAGPRRQALTYQGWSMAVNAAGDAAVAWTAPGRDLGDTRVLTRFRPAGGAWGTVEPGARGEGVDVDVSPEGRAAVAWMRVEKGRDHYYLAHRTASGAWTQPVSVARPTVTELSSEQASVDVDVAANGDTVVAVDGRGTAEHQVTRCPRGLACGRPFIIEVPLGEEHMMLESSSRGGGLLVWDRGGGTEEFAPQSIRSRSMRPLAN